LVLLVIVLLAGCATGGRSARIREIKSDDAADCKYLGVVEASDRSGWTMADDQLGAMSVIRRLVGEKGGNAFVLTHGDRNAYAPALRADVYRCH
jgi:hypothetical protein